MCESFDHGGDDIFAPGVTGTDFVTYIKDVFPVLRGKVLVGRFGYQDSQYEAQSGSHQSAYRRHRQRYSAGPETWPV